MYDVEGNELEVGDKVAFCKVGQIRLRMGIIQKFSTKQATIRQLDADGTLSTTSYQFSEMREPVVEPLLISRASDQIAKVYYD